MIFRLQERTYVLCALALAIAAPGVLGQTTPISTDRPSASAGPGVVPRRAFQL